jgi:arylsulfatase
VLFTYSGLATNDANLWQHVTAARIAGKNPKEELKKEGFRPDLKKRGSVRTIFDGRHKFTRYFAPVDRNRPTTIDELYQWNDVELFDLTNDRGEMANLAADRAANSQLVQEMSNKLEALIKTEIGADDGREMPDVPHIDWTIDRVDL